jgi:hypothetical protein
MRHECSVIAKFGATSLPIEDEGSKQRRGYAGASPFSDRIVPVASGCSMGLVPEVSCPYQGADRIETQPFGVGQVGGPVAALPQSGGFPKHFAADPAEVGWRGLPRACRIDAIPDDPIQGGADGFRLVAAETGNDAGAKINIGWDQTHRHDNGLRIHILRKLAQPN